MSDVHSAQACLARLVEMDAALAALRAELPDDMVAVGARAQSLVARWRNRLATGETDLEELSAAMREISSLMDSLTARLLLQPWEAPPPGMRS